MTHTNGHRFGLAAGAALGFFAGLAMPHVRKAVAQGPSLAAGDWVAALTAEHEMVRKAFDLVLQTGDDEKLKREALLTKIGYALTKHAVEEENVIYPALAAAGRQDEARDLADEHMQIKSFIYELRRIPSASTEWLVRAREFHAVLIDHMREEEDELFPALRDGLGEAENAKLTGMMNWEGFKVA
jgi:hemerythrin superfamily protein